MEYVPCIGNSSYSFWWILLKLYRCFKDGLEICILFFQNPEINFYHFFRIFNLDIFWALILQICIWSIYLVSATPPTVFGESFWNFTVVFRMVWRYAYCFLRILKLFFLHFNLDIFSSLYATDMYREYMPCIGNPAYSFRPILLKLYRYFAAFLWLHMRNLSLAGYNCSGGASCMACSFMLVLFLGGSFGHVNRWFYGQKTQFATKKTSDFTSPNDNFHYSYPHSNAVDHIFSSKLHYFGPNLSAISNLKLGLQPMKSDIM